MATLTYEEIKGSKVKTKFYSELGDKIFTRSELIKKLEWDWNCTPQKSLDWFICYHDLPCDLQILIVKQFRRWDKWESRMRIHNFECENATGSNCSCWCNEMYHGLRGSPSPFDKRT